MTRPIPNFPGYSVTDTGEVRSEPRKGRVSGRWLKPGHSDGYLFVVLCRDGKQYPCRVHRLVLEAFVGPCPAGMGTCHANGIRTDNRVSNLRWDTRVANAQDAVKHGTSGGFKARGETSSAAKLTEQQVRQIREEYNTGQFFQWEIAERHGITRPTVGCIIRGETWKHLIGVVIK